MLKNGIIASQAKPSQAKPSQAKPSQAKPSQAKPALEVALFSDVNFLIKKIKAAAKGTYVSFAAAFCIFKKVLLPVVFVLHSLVCLP